MVDQPPPETRLVLPRRKFLAGMAGLALVGACQGGNDSLNGGAVASSIDELLLIQPGFADGFRVPSTLAAGTTVRAPFFLFDGNGGPAVKNLPERVTAELTAPDGTATPVELVRHDAGIPTPYFLLSFDAEQVGIHRLHAVLRGDMQETEFQVVDPGDVDLVEVGEPLRIVDTATLDDARGFDPICTRFDPCPYHEVNLADVVANGRPTALLISTPGYCQTSICGPSVELLIELDPGDAIDVIHSEVYTEPERINEVGFDQLIGPTVRVYGMSFEPSFIVADATGTVTSRLDFSFDRVEMAASLARVI